MFVIKIEDWASFEDALDLIFGKELSPDEMAAEQAVRRYRVIHDQTGAIDMELIEEEA